MGDDCGGYFSGGAAGQVLDKILQVALKMFDSSYHQNRLIPPHIRAVARRKFSRRV
jgi:hypothetical protein